MANVNENREQSEEVRMLQELKRRLDAKVLLMRANEEIPLALATIKAVWSLETIIKELREERYNKYLTFSGNQGNDEEDEEDDDDIVPEPRSLLNNRELRPSVVQEMPGMVVTGPGICIRTNPENDGDRNDRIRIRSNRGSRSNRGARSNRDSRRQSEERQTENRASDTRLTIEPHEMDTRLLHEVYEVAIEVANENERRDRERKEQERSQQNDREREESSSSNQDEEEAIEPEEEQKEEEEKKEEVRLTYEERARLRRAREEREAKLNKPSVIVSLERLAVLARRGINRGPFLKGQENDTSISIPRHHQELTRSDWECKIC